MMRRGDSLAKRTMPHGIGKVVAACSGGLPLFSVPELDEARRERARLIHQLATTRLEVRTRYRKEQKLALLTAKIIRLEMQLGGRP